MEILANFGKSNVPKSPRFKEIMEKYELVGKHMSVREFHREYVEKIDPNIKHRPWHEFIKKYAAEVERQIKLKAEHVLKLSTENAVTEHELEERSLRKLLVIADVTLDELIKNPKLINEIPLKDRIDWLMKTMKARDSRANVMIKKKTEQRKTNMYEDVMKGAQYGAINADEIEDEQAPPEKKTEPKKIEESKGVIIPVAATMQKQVEFKPEDL